MLTLLIIAIILAIALPALGVVVDGRIVAAVLLIVLLVWLVGDGGLVARG